MSYSTIENVRLLHISSGSSQTRPGQPQSIDSPTDFTKAEDSLADFSNDLASDLGPLLALFGESMTKQYLSESTSFLDYLIFAMGPIGIITAMVSVIRVCGHPSLKAFIGRSQEGDGVVETELCTSTSRDVCEVFNRNGVTRVLGRPRVLELVYIRSDPRKLFLFKHYLRAPETWDWKRSTGSNEEAEKNPPADAGVGDRDVEANLDSQTVVEGPETLSADTKSSDKTDLHDLFAPTPNLSLNVGIVRRPSLFYVVVATIGIILQSGVLVLAAVGHWVLGWNLSDEGDRGSGDYAPVMFITGTVLLCGGMWACAASIGHITEEPWYTRKSEPDSPPPLHRNILRIARLSLAFLNLTLPNQPLPLPCNLIILLLGLVPILSGLKRTTPPLWSLRRAALLSLILLSLPLLRVNIHSFFGSSLVLKLLEIKPLILLFILRGTKAL
ncbi:hypothetical protein CGCVW01_v010219 [Colletotrichum viniferum]|nr:hypothetical protein CGCVW01_v010219 [Colletotrichum viniferum]